MPVISYQLILAFSIHPAGFLTFSEWKTMKLHSALGSQIISMISGHEAGSEIIVTNHDHYNDMTLATLMG